MTYAIPSLGFPSRGSRVRPPSPAPGIARLAVWLACRPFAFRAAAFQMLRVRSRSPGSAARSRHPVMVVLRLLVVQGTPVPTLAEYSNERAKRPPVAGTTEFRGLTRVRRQDRCGIGWSPAASVSQRDVSGLVGWFRPSLRADEHGASETADKAGRDSGAPAARLHDPVPRHSAVEVRGPGDAFGGRNLNPRGADRILRTDRPARAGARPSSPGRSGGIR